MSTTSQGPTTPRTGAGPSNGRKARPRAGVDRLVALAIVVLVIGLPLVLVLTTVVTLAVLSWSPSYESSLSVTTSIAVLATTGLAGWIGMKVRRRSPGAGTVVVGASVFAAVTALFLTMGGLESGAGDLPAPTVVNASSSTVVIYAGTDGDLHRWTTLAPGEHALADRPFLSTDGCYHGMWLEARTTDGRVIGNLFAPCTSDTWRITDSGATRL